MFNNSFCVALHEKNVAGFDLNSLSFLRGNNDVKSPYMMRQYQKDVGNYISRRNIKKDCEHFSRVLSFSFIKKKGIASSSK